MKKLFLIPMAIMLVGALIFGGCAASAPAPAPAPPQEVIELRVNSHWPPGSVFVKEFYTPPLEAIQEKSNGRITYKMFAGGALGGGTEQYENARVGKFDVAADITTLYTPGRFPLTDVLSLPIYFPPKSDTVMVSVAMAVFDRILYREYEDTKTFGLYIVPNFSPLGNVKIMTLDDWKGLKVRTLGGIITESILALGASPVAMPIPDLYLSLDTGVVDVGAMHHSAIPVFKFYEVSKYFMQGFSLGNTVNGIVMNKATWDKIPDDLKPMVEEELRRSGYLMNKGNEDNEEKNFKLMTDAGVEIYTPSQEEIGRWNEVLSSMVSSWVKELEAKGLPAQEALDIYRDEVQKAGLLFPF